VDRVLLRDIEALKFASLRPLLKVSNEAAFYCLDSLISFLLAMQDFWFGLKIFFKSFAALTALLCVFNLMLVAGPNLEIFFALFLHQFFTTRQIDEHRVEP